MHVENNVGESLVRTLLNSPGKTKDGMNARLDLSELGIKPELFARQEEDKTTLPLAGYTLTNVEKDIFCETLSNIKVPQGYFSNFFSLVSLKDMKLIGLKPHEYHMLMQEFLPIAICLIMHPPTRYATIRRHKKVLKTKNPCKQIALLENEHSGSFARLRELAISKYSVSETVRWISYGPCATIVKYEAYNINGYTFRMKSNDGIVYQNNGVSVEAVDLYISKEVVTTRKAFYYGVLQEIWDFNLSINCLLHVGIKSLLDAVRVTAAHICVNVAQLELVLLMNFIEKICQVFTTVGTQLMP
nr:hypothetical protein [Tanacetum cinerariifolium]